MTRIQPAPRLLIAPLLLLGIALDANSQNSKAPFSIRISSPQVSVEAGSDARIQVVVTNTSGVVSRVGTCGTANALYAGFQAHVYDTQNHHLRMTPKAWFLSGKKASADDKNDYSGVDYSQAFLVTCSNVDSEGGEPLFPGRILTYSFKLFDAYNLTPGKYTISVSIQDWKSKVVVTSNKMEITVTEGKPAPPPPPDPFSIRIDTPQPVVAAGSAPTIHVLLTNTSNQPIAARDAFHHGPLAPTYSFFALEAYANDAIGQHWVFYGTAPGFPLQPGLTSETKLELFTPLIPSPGQYTVWVSGTDPASKLVVNSNTLAITVTGAAK